MKVIRVSGCHDCTYKGDGSLPDEDFWRCLHRDNYWAEITIYVIDKTLPDNCPLEEDKDKYKRGHDVAEFYRDSTTYNEIDDKKDNTLRELKP